MLPLLISRQRDDVAGSYAVPPDDGCAYCGLPAGLHGDGPRCCALCHLVRHLERPRIDDELYLIWLPEMSQAALLCLVREMHCRLRGRGESFDNAGFPAMVTPDGSAIHYARAALMARSDAAAEHLGTKRPSELSHILARISRSSYDRRHRLLAGLRALPQGRFFIGSEDFYPSIVDFWRRPRSAANTPLADRGVA